MFKQSKFNYTCKNDDGELLIYNTYIGAKSMCKIRDLLLQDTFLNNISIENESVLSSLLSRGVLVNDDLDENLKLKNLIHKILSPSDLKLVISLTEQCNFLCKYCYESHNKIKLTSDVKYNIVNYIRHNIHKFTDLNITWFGGEPLLALDDIIEMSQEFIKICTFNRRKYTASMTTNGYLLDVEIFKELLRNRVWAYQITLDGTKELHDKQRPTVGGKPTFDTIVKNLEEIKKLKNRDFHIVIRSNLTSDIFNHLDEYMEFISYLCGDDNRFSLSVCYASEWSDNIDKDFKDTFINNRNNIFPLYEKFLKCKSQINFAFLLNPEDGACELGRDNRFFVRPNGELHKCSVGFENKKNIIGVFSGNQITLSDNYYEKIIDPSMCSNFESCFFAPICKGEVCPAVRSEKNTSCPDSKNHLSYILRLLDKSNQIVRIDEK
ncbi:MAG: radical SAM protein [Clostridia bacterium]